MRWQMARGAAACIWGVAVSVVTGTAARAGDPDFLWKTVHEFCVPDQQVNNDPQPCVAVNLAGGETRGHVVFKDREGATQFLVIPTARLNGIESREVLSATAPPYFAAAWAARSNIESVLHRALPRDEIGLAINSVDGRTQNQLHIHVDCLRMDVIDSLRAHLNAIGKEWAAFPEPLAGHAYVARRLEDATLRGINPLRLLADGVPGAARDMAHETLVIAGAIFADGRPGFVLLADRVDPATGDRASGEELQDHACAVGNSDGRREVAALPGPPPASGGR